MHFVRNAAYYQAWNAAHVARQREQFWRTLNGNFIGGKSGTGKIRDRFIFLYCTLLVVPCAYKRLTSFEL